MSSVDNRIVNMQFNNKQFTQGVNQSERDLRGLDKTLANAGKSKGLTTMASGAQQVATKFSAMQIAGVTAIATIANKATVAGINMVKSLTISPIMDGFREYQTGLTSVQTIMANTGKSVKVVNGYLDELNAYSDQTIYNFGQMAKNIGTFTAAGVELGTATSAIKGISNLAALSGSTSQQASTAMYQLSQAISAGKVGLQDWNSVVNAGMAGKQFKTALARTAVAMGDISQNAVKVGTDVQIMGQSFRQSISAAAGQESWLSSDVLVKTLATLDGRFSKTRMEIEGLNSKQEINNELTKERAKLAKEGLVYTDKEFKAMTKMADAAFQSATTIKTFPQLMDVVKESMGSMWAGAFEIILGDFKQSKKLWTSVGEVITGPNGIISNMSKSFLGTLGDWEEAGGRDMILKGFERLGKGVKRVFGALKGAFQDVFPPGASNLLVDISRGFKRMMLIFKPGEETVESLRSIFGGLFAILHIGAVVFRGIVSAAGAFFKAIFKGSDDARGGILSTIGSVGEVIKAFDAWLTQGGKLSEFMSKFGTVAGAFVSPVLGAIGLVVKAFATLASGQGISAALEPLQSAKESVLEFVSNALGGLESLTARFEWLSNVFGKIKDKVDSLRGSFEGVANPIEGVTDKLGQISSLGSMGKFGATASGALDRVKGAADSVTESAGEMYDSFGSKKSEVASSSTEKVAAVGEKASSVFEQLAGFLSNAWGKMKTVASALGGAIGWIAGHVADLFKGFDAMDWVGFINGIFSGALLIQISKFLKNTGGFGESLRQTFDALTETLGKMQKAIYANAILQIALAVGVLVAALGVLSLLDQGQLMKGVGTIGILVSVLVAAMAVLGRLGTVVDENGDSVQRFNVQLLTMGASMLMMAFAILTLSAAVAIFGNMDPETLGQGIAGIAMALGILVAAMLGLDKMKGSTQGLAASLLVMAIALNVLSTAVYAMGKMDYATLEQGIGGMAAALGILVGAMLGMDMMKGSTEGLAASLLVMSIALVVLTASITALGNLSPETLAQGLGAMGIALGLMVLSLLAMASAGPNIVAAAGAMLMISAAMMGMALAVSFFGQMDPKTIGIGFAAIALGLGLLLLAALGAQFVIPGLIVLGIVVKLLGMAMALAGLGMLAFGTGFAIFAAAGVAGVAVLTAAFHVFLALLPTLATQLGASFVAFIVVIANASTKLRAAFGTIFSNMIGVVRDAIPEIGALISDLVTEIYRVVRDAIPEWGATVTAFLDEAIRIFTSFGPTFMTAGWDMIQNIIDAGRERLPGIVRTATDLCLEFLNEIGKNSVRFADEGAQIIIDTLNGLSDAIERRGPEIRAAAGRLANTFFAELKAAFSDLMSGWSIPMPDVGGAAKSVFKKLTGQGGDGAAGSGSGMDPLAALSRDVVALLGANNINLMYDTPGLVGLANATSAQRAIATQAKSQSEFLDQRATRAEERSADRLAAAKEKRDKVLDKKKATKKQKEKAKAAVKAANAETAAANRVRSKANAAAKNAERQEMLSTEASERLQYSVSMAESQDATASADTAANYAASVAEKAQASLERANALNAEADHLAKGSKKDQALSKKLRTQAEKEAQDARRWADEAQKANQAATDFYAQAKREAAQAVHDRIRALIESQLADAKARADEKEYEEATASRKAEIMDARAEANEKLAQTREAEAAALLDQARALAETDAEAANLKVDAAEKAAAEASSAANAAVQERRSAEEQREQAKQEAASGGSTSGGGAINPSRIALEDAARAVDRYAASMSQAEEAAAATPSVYQYIQNNTSPKALSSAEIYRNGKNLLSMHELKMGAS